MEKPVLNNKIYGVYQRCNLVLMVPVRWWSSIQRSSNCIPLKTDVRLKWMSPTSVRQPTIYLHHWETIIKFKGNRLAIVLLSVWSRPADFVWKLSIAFVAFYQDENENVEPRERPIFWCPLSFFLMSFLSVFLSFCLFVFLFVLVAISSSPFCTCRHDRRGLAATYLLYGDNPKNLRC